MPLVLLACTSHQTLHHLKLLYLCFVCACEVCASLASFFFILIFIKEVNSKMRQERERLYIEEHKQKHCTVSPFQFSSFGSEKLKNFITAKRLLADMKNCYPTLFAWFSNILFCFFFGLCSMCVNTCCQEQHNYLGWICVIVHANRTVLHWHVAIASPKK